MDHSKQGYGFAFVFSGSRCFSRCADHDLLIVQDPAMRMILEQMQSDPQVALDPSVMFLFKIK